MAGKLLWWAYKNLWLPLWVLSQSLNQSLSLCLFLSSTCSVEDSYLSYLEDTQTNYRKPTRWKTEALSSIGHEELRPTDNHLSGFRSGFFQSKQSLEMTAALDNSFAATSWSRFLKQNHSAKPLEMINVHCFKLLDIEVIYFTICNLTK